jgi:hypothetical protein
MENSVGSGNRRKSSGEARELHGGVNDRAPSFMTQSGHKMCNRDRPTIMFIDIFVRD